MPWGNVKAQIFGNVTPKATPILCLHGYLDNSNSFLPLAPFICQNNEYYMISMDLPGHGFSSKLPDGIQYTPKLFLTSVRRVVKHFDLKSFIFMCHSYGVGISYMVNLFIRIVFLNPRIL
jgi:pimeloyl-ACP methyl ester carboxylesterase